MNSDKKVNILCLYFGTNEGCFRGRSCKYIHPCRNFEVNGLCSFGDACRYDHVCKKYKSSIGCIDEGCKYVHLLKSTELISPSNTTDSHPLGIGTINTPTVLPVITDFI